MYKSYTRSNFQFMNTHTRARAYIYRQTYIKQHLFVTFKLKLYQLTFGTEDGRETSLVCTNNCPRQNVSVIIRTNKQHTRERLHTDIVAGYAQTMLTAITGVSVMRTQQPPPSTAYPKSSKAARRYIICDFF